MTGNGTFFINGTERVIVSQMHRSPGVLFDHDRGKTHSSGKYLFAARVIPYRGSWLDFEFDAKDIVNVRIDRKRKLPVTTLLYSLGLNSEEILNHFYDRVTFARAKGGWKIPFNAEQWRASKPSFDIVDAKSGEVIFPAGQKITPRAANKAVKDGLEELLIPTEEIFGRYSALILSTTRPAASMSRQAMKSPPKTSKHSTRPASTASNCSTSTMSSPAPGCATR
jgi:DNA-directed RNA polymerase subunit beta